MHPLFCLLWSQYCHWNAKSQYIPVPNLTPYPGQNHANTGSFAHCSSTLNRHECPWECVCLCVFLPADLWCSPCKKLTVKTAFGDIKELYLCSRNITGSKKDKRNRYNVRWRETRRRTRRDLDVTRSRHVWPLCHPTEPSGGIGHHVIQTQFPQSVYAVGLPLHSTTDWLVRVYQPHP